MNKNRKQEMLRFFVFMTVLGVWLAFMAGELCTIVRFSMIPLVRQIRALEGEKISPEGKNPAVISRLNR